MNKHEAQIVADRNERRDEWTIEVYYIDPAREHDRTSAVSAWRALEMVETMLADAAVGGVVAYRSTHEMGS